MATAFPSITPTARRFTAPTWPTNTQRSQSGVITRRLWGSKPANATLSLQFSNVSDDEAATILAAYDDAKGSTDTLTLPFQIFSGMSNTLKGETDGSAASLQWSFAEGSPPQVESVAPGISSVSVNLTGELRVS